MSMPRARRRVTRPASLTGGAALALGLFVFAGAGCGSSSHGVVGAGGSGGNAHGDAAGDGTGSGAGGGGGAAATGDGGADARGAGGAGATTGAGGGSGAVDAASDAYGAGCNTLTLGAAVTIACAPDGGTPPAPTGGTLVPGTYVLTAAIDYDFCNPFPVAETVVLSGNTFQTVIDSPATGVSRANSTFTVSGTVLNLTQTCPTTNALNSLGFSVSTAAGVTTMTLTSELDTTTTVGVYTKQ